MTIDHITTVTRERCSHFSVSTGGKNEATVFMHHWWIHQEWHPDNHFAFKGVNIEESQSVAALPRGRSAGMLPGNVTSHTRQGCVHNVQSTQCSTWRKTTQKTTLTSRTSVVEVKSIWERWVHFNGCLDFAPLARPHIKYNKAKKRLILMNSGKAGCRGARCASALL